MMPGDASFLGPAGPKLRRFTWAARASQRHQNEQPKKNSPQASPETQAQQISVNSSVFVAGVARARARRPENQREKSKGRAERELAATKAKRTEQQPNAHVTNGALSLSTPQRPKRAYSLKWQGKMGASLASLWWRTVGDGKRKGSLFGEPASLQTMILRLAV